MTPVPLQIPRSYLTLQDAVTAEKQRRHAEGEVQYLTEAQLDHIIQQNPGSDMRDYEDLQTGTETIIGWTCVYLQYLCETSSHFLGLDPHKPSCPPSHQP